MQRRTFMDVTLGAATALALKPWALAEEQERKSLVAYPDPAVEVIDPRFTKYKVGNAAVERLYTGTRWAEGPVWFGAVLSGEKLTRSSQACDSEELRCSLRRERFEFNLPEIKGFGGAWRLATMAHESWPNRLLAIDRASAAQGVSEVRSSLPRQLLSKKLFLLGPVSRDGLCPIDLSREPARHRSLPSLSAE